MLAGIFLVIGLIIGTRVGLRGLVMFWGGIGMIYVMIKVPLGIHGFAMRRMSGGNSELAAGLFLIVSIVLLLWIFLELGAMIFDELYLDVLPEGIDRAFGGALGGALGWILIKIIF